MHQSSLRVFRAEDGGQETSNRQKGFSDVERDSFHGKGRRKRSADHHESLVETFRPRFWTGKTRFGKTSLIKHNKTRFDKTSLDKTTSDKTSFNTVFLFGKLKTFILKNVLALNSKNAAGFIL